MADNERIDEILGVILANPEAHQQGLWVNNYSESTAGALREDCGTTACIAGWAVLLFCPQDAVISASRFSGVLGPRFVNGRHIFEVARELLGLTQEQAVTIFHMTPRERVIAMLKYIKDHPKASTHELLEVW